MSLDLRCPGDERADMLDALEAGLVGAPFAYARRDLTASRLLRATETQRLADALILSAHLHRLVLLAAARLSDGAWADLAVERRLDGLLHVERVFLEERAEGFPLDPTDEPSDRTRHDGPDLVGRQAGPCEAERDVLREHGPATDDAGELVAVHDQGRRGLVGWWRSVGHRVLSILSRGLS